MGCAWLTAPHFATAFLPIMAALGGFIATGIIEGMVSKARTVIAPGISAFMITVVMMFVFPALQFKGFQNMTMSDMILLAFNGIICAIIGGWVGEMFRYGRIIQAEEQKIGEYVDKNTALHQQKGSLKESVDVTPIEWRWILCGLVVGIMQSILIASLHFATFARSTNPAESLLIPFLCGLAITGFVVGWLSPGHTLNEAALSGFMTVVIDMNIIVVGLATEVAVSVMVGSMIVGLVIALLGGMLGDKFGTMTIAKKSINVPR